MNWRDALADQARDNDAPAGDANRVYRPAKYKKGDTVQTHFTAWPGKTMTQHEVIQVWTRAEGYKGASDAGYMLSPMPRGAVRYLDEGWITPVANTSTTKRSKP